MATNHTEYTFERPVTPSFIIQRRESLRTKALEEGLKALLAIEASGGQAVLFGSVLRPGDFSERSDIDICVMDPPTFKEGIEFFSIAEKAIHDFKADVSWLNELTPEVKSNVVAEGLNAASLRRGLQRTPKN